MPGGWLPAIWNGSLDSVKEDTVWGPVFLWSLSREVKTAGFLHPLLGWPTCPGLSETSSALALSIPLLELCMPGQLALLVTLYAAVCGIRSREDTKFYQESRKTGHRFRES